MVVPRRKLGPLLTINCFISEQAHQVLSALPTPRIRQADDARVRFVLRICGSVILLKLCYFAHLPARQTRMSTFTNLMKKLRSTTRRLSWGGTAMAVLVAQPAVKHLRCVLAGCFHCSDNWLLFRARNKVLQQQLYQQSITHMAVSKAPELLLLSLLNSVSPSEVAAANGFSAAG